MTMLRTAETILRGCCAWANFSIPMAKGMLIAIAKSIIPKIDPIPKTSIYNIPTPKEGTVARTSNKRAALPARP